jgi:site-specific DNA-adenine methylase
MNANVADFSALATLYKMVGSKAAVADALVTSWPDARLVEPFFGGGSVVYAYATRHPDAPIYASEIDTSITQVICGLRDAYETTQAQYEAILATRTTTAPQMVSARGRAARDPTQGIATAIYYAERAAWNRGERTPGRALFLRRHAFRGLIRHSSGGNYSVPFESTLHDLRPFPSALAERVADFWRAPHRHFRQADVFEVLPEVLPDDILYLDPPYCSTYASYQPGGWSRANFITLVQQAAELAEQGVRVALSHDDDTDATEDQDARQNVQILREHWPSARVLSYSVDRMIARSSRRTGRAAQEMYAISPSLYSHIATSPQGA